VERSDFDGRRTKSSLVRRYGLVSRIKLLVLPRETMPRQVAKTDGIAISTIRYWMIL